MPTSKLVSVTCLKATAFFAIQRLVSLLYSKVITETAINKLHYTTMIKAPSALNREHTFRSTNTLKECDLHGSEADSATAKFAAVSEEDGRVADNSALPMKEGNID